jgi:thiol-disulfide isomerase/thioredoxin
MRRTNHARGLLMAAVLLGAGCASTSGGAGSGTVAPFSRPSMTGGVVDLKQHLGRDVVLLSFWTTWCEPCKVEMPFLQTFQDTYGPQGLKIVSVAMDGPDTVAEVRPYLNRMGYTFSVVLDEDGAIAQRLNPVSAAPFAILVGRDGKVRQRFQGFKAGEAPILEAAIKAALADTGAPSTPPEAPAPSAAAPSGEEAASDPSNPAPEATPAEVTPEAP